MDINGVWASVNFPSQITGFCGRVFSQCSDPELGLAVHPGVERLALRGVVLAASRAHRPAGHHVPRRPRARAPRRSGATPSAGFTVGDAARAAAPHRPAVDLHGLLGPDHRRRAPRPTPSICLHVGSLGRGRHARRASPDALPLGATLFGQLSLTACAEWLWSGYPVRYPDLKIAMSEGGIGWVAMLHRPAREHRRPLRLRRCGWDDRARPRCCSATSGSAPSTTRRRSTPATRSASTTSWSRSTTRTATAPGPTPRPSSRSTGATSPTDELRLMCCENAAALYRHPLPRAGAALTPR